MLMVVDDIVVMICVVIFDVDVVIIDLVGDGDYYVVCVISVSFVGFSWVKQYKVVYDVFGGCMGGVFYVFQFIIVIV